MRLTAGLLGLLGIALSCAGSALGQCNKGAIPTGSWIEGSFRVIECTPIGSASLDSLSALPEGEITKLDSQERAHLARARVEAARAAGRDPWLIGEGSDLGFLWEDSPEALTANAEESISTSEFAFQHSHASSLSLTRGADDLKTVSGGPKVGRFVRDPIAPERVIDMRHFLAVGSKPFPEISGLAIECLQFAQSLGGPPELRESLRRTAFDPQDLYSNALGAEFFARHYSEQRGPIAPQIAGYLRGRMEAP